MASLPWYVARSAGLLAWALLTASVLWGLALSTKILGRRPRPNWLLDLHRFLGGLAAIFTVVHIVGVLLDNYVPFGLLNVLVPFTGTWRPGAVAWGIAGLYLLAAVELTSLARARLPKRVWRAIHVASFPLFLTATVHAFTAGTDAHTWVFEVCAVLAVSAVAGLTAARIAKDVGVASPAAGRTQPAAGRTQQAASRAHPARPAAVPKAQRIPYRPSVAVIPRGPSQPSDVPDRVAQLAECVGGRMDG